MFVGERAVFPFEQLCRTLQTVDDVTDRRNNNETRETRGNERKILA